MKRLSLALAFAGIRARRLQTAITIVVVAVAAGTLTIALGVGRVADRPFERTFAAANGAHVTVRTLGPGGPDLRAVGTLPGVEATTDVVPGVFTAFTRDGRRFGLSLLGVGSTPPAVERPLVVEGRWPGAGEILLEQSFARFLRMRPGDRLTTSAGTALRVSGIAAFPVGEAYPRSQPGTAFALRATLTRVAPDPSRWGHALGVRLDDPLAADEFAMRARALVGPGPAIDTWIETRADARDLAHTISVILGVYSTLLLLTVGAVLATLVGGRIVAQTTQIGLLKATGLTPRHVATLYVVEQGALAAIGCALGLLLGRLTTPFFTAPSATLLAASETPAFDLVDTLVVVGVVLGLVSACTLVPALRVARRPTAWALRAGVSPLGARSRLGGLASRLHLPLPAVLGARRSFARPGRAGLTIVSLALAVVAAVGTLGMEASLDVANVPPPAPALDGSHPAVPAWDPVDDDTGEGATLRPIVYGLDGLLLLVGLANLLATLILTTREQTRDLGLLKAVGVTPRQLLGAVLTSQAVAAMLAGIAGIPLGLGLFRLAIGLSGSSDEFAYPPAWTLPAVACGVVLAVAAIVVPLARRAASLRVTDALRYE